MTIKPEKTRVHKQLKLLSRRTTLSKSENKYLENMDSGLEGELYLADILSKNLNRPIQLFDLHLKLDRTECQIDCLLIYQNDCILIEVKNFQGDYIDCGELWRFKHSKKEFVTPLNQLKRTSTCLKNYFVERRIDLTVHSFIVFTSRSFLLYQAPVKDTIIFPNQIEKFMQTLNSIPCHLNHTHYEIAETLKSMHIERSIYEEKLNYGYLELRKGIICKRCDAFIKEVRREQVICSKCKHGESKERAIIDSAREFHLLFPEKKITVKAIGEWTGNLITRVVIRRTLIKHCETVYKGKYTYYLLK